MSEDKPEPSMALRGWSPCLKRQWFAPAVSADRRIVGDLFLSSSVEAVYEATTRSCRCVTLCIQPAVISDKSPSEHATEQMVFYRQPGSSFFLQLESSERLVQGEWTVCLPIDEFEAVWAGLREPLSAHVSGTLFGTSHFEPFKLVQDHVIAPILDFRAQVLEHESGCPAWAQNVAAADIREALSTEHFGRQYSDVARIVNELSRSASQHPPSERCRLESVHAIKDLLEGIRPAFRARLSLSGDTFSDAWDLPAADFVKAISDRGEDDATKLKKRYDSLWQHFNVAWVLKRGENEYGAKVEGLEPHVEQLEGVAWKLLALPGMHSVTLEWALVDALIYAECVAFAQTALSGETLLGYPVQGELKGSAGAATWKAWGKQVLHRALAFVVEALKIGATFFVANILAQDNVQTAWVITTGVTVARWIRLGMPAQAKTPQHAINDLMGKMAGAHELLKSEQFNARALRQALYEASSAGAVFSPWVYNILDARIRREGQ